MGSGKETSLSEGGVWEGDQSIGGWGLGRRPVYRRVGSGKETISVAIDKIKLHYWSKYWITLKISRHCNTYLRVLHNYMYIE